MKKKFYLYNTGIFFLFLLYYISFRFICPAPIIRFARRNRRIRVKKMQLALDREHRERFGWDLASIEAQSFNRRYYNI